MALFKRKSKPVYEDPYAAQLQEQANKVLSRPTFSYDPGKDPMYGALKDQAVKNGRMAMLDTQAQAANLTGGYGSSYGQQAGQQAYQAYLQDLNDLLPELQTAARAAYDSETDKLLTQYQLTAQAADRDYSRYQDELAAYWQESALDRQEALDENNLKQQNRNNLLSLLQAGYTPTQEELDAAGLTQAQASALLPKVSPGGGGSSSGGGEKIWGAKQDKTLGEIWKTGGYKDARSLLERARYEFAGYPDDKIIDAVARITSSHPIYANTQEDFEALVAETTKTYGVDEAEEFVADLAKNGYIDESWAEDLDRYFYTERMRELLASKAK